MTPCRNLIILGGQDQIRYLLNDDFSDTRAAGQVNGTHSVPGPGTRTVTDTESKLSLAGSRAVFSGGKATPSTGDPGVWITPAITRSAGKIHKFAFNSSSGILWLGLSTGTSGGLTGYGVSVNGVSLNVRSNGAGGWSGDVVCGTIVNSIDYQVALVLRSNGCYYFLRIGWVWKLLFISDATTASTFYQCILNYNSASNSDYIRTPETARYLPTPCVYDTFTRADGALGSTQSTGPDGQGSPVIAWQGSTWSVSSGKAINTPGVGSELLTNGGFETGDPPTGWYSSSGSTLTQVAESRPGSIGIKACQASRGSNIPVMYQTNATSVQWYKFSGWVKNINATSVAIRIGQAASPYTVISTSVYSASNSWNQLVCTGRAIDSITGVYGLINGSSGQIGIFDDFNFAMLNISYLFSKLSCSTKDIIATAIISGMTAGTQCGMVLRYTDDNNFLILHHNGLTSASTLILEECVNGTYNTIGSSAACNFAAGELLRVVLNGTTANVYHSANGTTWTHAVQNGSVNAALTGTTHGLFSTYEGNQVDTIEVIPVGSNNEHRELDRY